MTIHNIFGSKKGGGNGGDGGDGGNGDDEEFKKQHPKIEKIIFEHEDQGEEFHFPQDRASSIRGAIFIRWLLLMVFFLALVTFIFQALCAAISLIMNIFTLFKNDTAREVLYRYWKGVGRWLVFSAGSLIGVISPGLGLGFVVLYFAMRSEQQREDFFTQFFMTQYHNMRK